MSYSTNLQATTTTTNMFIMPGAMTLTSNLTTKGFTKPIDGIPDWMTAEGYYMLRSGYLLEGETPWDAYVRLAEASANALKKPKLANKFFEIMWKGWLGPASPILANLGTSRGLPISCNSNHIEDSLTGIFNSISELAHLSSKGAGVGVYIGDIRGRGEPIKGGYVSEGVIPWCKVIDATTISTSQGGVRRGATAVYLPFRHPDVRQFINMRRPIGDENQRCMNIHHAICLSDQDMLDIQAGGEAQELFIEILKARLETGEPYLFFIDNVNRVRPLGYEELHLFIKTSNICLLGTEEVITSEGSRPIKDLVGKTVTIWDGNNWVENSRFEYKGDATQLVEVTYKDGSKIQTTLNHRFPLVDGKFVEAKDLQPNMQVEVHELIHHGDTELSAAYLKGFLLADGSYKHNGPLLWLYDTKYMCEERLLEEANTVSLDSKLNTNTITIPSFKESGHNRKVLRGITCRQEELLGWCTSYKESLPEGFLNWSLVSKQEFIAGLFDGDGTVINNSCARCYQLASIHKTFIEQIQLLLKSMGVQSSINLMRKAGKTDFNDGYGKYATKDCYRLTVSNTSAYKLSDMCKFSRLIQHQRPTKKAPYKTKPGHGKIIDVQIISVESTPTYCTTVPSTSKFALASGHMTGNCSEVVAYTDPAHTFVCCLSSMNLAKWEEWRHTKAVYYATWFLDGVMQSYIDQTKDMPFFENARRFSVKSRMLGLGVLGWHSLLQQKMLPFESFGASLLNRAIFKHLAAESNQASKDMAAEYGEPEWCQGTGLRNTHTLTCAPTVTNSIICGHVSPGIEPFTANAFEKKTSRGTMFFFNPTFKELLESKGKDDEEVWNSIVEHEGSVQHLDFLTEQEKEVFLTARELNQMAIIDQAAERQKEMDAFRQGQSQSVNLFFTADPDPTYFAKVHFAAWKKGLKTLYYCRSQAKTKAQASANVLPASTKAKIENISKGGDDICLACQG